MFCLGPASLYPPKVLLMHSSPIPQPWNVKPRVERTFQCDDLCLGDSLTVPLGEVLALFDGLVLWGEREAYSKSLFPHLRLHLDLSPSPFPRFGLQHFKPCTSFSSQITTGPVQNVIKPCRIYFYLENPVIWFAFTQVCLQIGSFKALCSRLSAFIL